jgi:hypothetical protein
MAGKLLRAHDTNLNPVSFPVDSVQRHVRNTYTCGAAPRSEKTVFNRFLFGAID